YFAVAHWKLDGGATVTGSHNPVSDNGVKMVHAAAAPLTEEEIQGLLATITSGSFERGRATRPVRDPRAAYFDACPSRVHRRLRGRGGRAGPPPRGRSHPRPARPRSLDPPARRAGGLRRQVLAGADRRRAGPRRESCHVEDGPLSPQAQDARGRHPPRRRGL